MLVVSLDIELPVTCFFLGVGHQDFSACEGQ